MGFKLFSDFKIKNGVLEILIYANAFDMMFAAQTLDMLTV